MVSGARARSTQRAGGATHAPVTNAPVSQSEAEVPPPSELPGKGRRAGRQARREGTWREPWGSATCWRIMSYSCSTLAQMKGLSPPLTRHCQSHLARPCLSLPLLLSPPPCLSLASLLALSPLSTLSCIHMHRTLQIHTHRHGPNLAKYATTLNKHTNPFYCPLILQTNAAPGRRRKAVGR